jgi:hypothetical protein
VLKFIHLFKILIIIIIFRNSPHELKGFELPEFILNKVRSTMILNKPPDMQSPQQIIITENGEIEEQAV